MTAVLALAPAAPSAPLLRSRVAGGGLRGNRGAVPCGGRGAGFSFGGRSKRIGPLESVPPMAAVAQNIGSVAVDWADIPLPNLILSFVALYLIFYGADKVIPKEDVVQMAAKQNAKKGAEMREQALRMAQLAEERGEEAAAIRWRERAEELSAIIATNEEASK